MRAYTSGSWRRSQRSFGAVKPVSARLPVSSISRSRPTRSSISAHSAPVRWSFQRIAGRSTRSCASSATRPCIWPESPIAAGSTPSVRERRLRRLPPVLGILLRTIPAAASRADSRAPPARATSPLSVTATALTPVVPTSRPTSGLHQPAERGVHELVRGDRVLALLRRAQRGLVDPRGHAVDEPPLQHRPAHGGDRILRVRIEVEPEPLAVLAVAGAAELERDLERLHERGRADHVVVVERAPAGVRVLVAEQALRREQRGVLAEVLAVHDQVLPVHVDLDVVDPARAQLVDDVQRHADVAHVDLHRRLGVLVLEEEEPVAAREHLRGLGDPVDQPRPDLGVRHLERVVVALDAGPDDHVRADLAGELRALAGEPHRLRAHRVVERA